MDYVVNNFDELLDAIRIHEPFMAPEQAKVHAMELWNDMVDRNAKDNQNQESEMSKSGGDV